MRIEVDPSGCLFCPLHYEMGDEESYCNADPKKRTVSLSVLSRSVPDWCPLRTGDVTVGLKKEAAK